MPSAPTAAVAKAPTAAEARQAAHRRRYDLMAEHAGFDMRSAVKVHWKDATYTTWDEALAEMAAGFTVTLTCNGGVRGGWAKHRIHFGADGSIGLLDHPDRVIDAEAELLLVGLGGSMETCVAAAIFLESRQLVPSEVNSAHAAVNVRLRALRTAIAWARRPGTEWTPEWGEATLRYGITPEVLAAWEADGWDPEEAAPFLRTFADRAVADAWRADGQISQRAAKLAGRGEYPNEEQRWVDAGFAPSRSAKWRGTGLSPEVAWEWEAHNITPTGIASLTRAASIGGFTVDEGKQWCRAGLRVKDLLAWYRNSQGNMDEAIVWARAGVSPSSYKYVRDWNAVNPGLALAADMVGEFQKAGLRADDPAVLARAIREGVTPQEYKATVAALDPAHPTRLWADLTVHGSRADSRAWWMFQRDTIYPYYVNAMKRGAYPQVSAFIVDWIIRNR